MKINMKASDLSAFGGFVQYQVINVGYLEGGNFPDDGLRTDGLGNFEG